MKITQKGVKNKRLLIRGAITRQMGDAYLQCETLIIVYFFVCFLLIFWGIFHYIVLLIVLLWHRAPTLSRSFFYCSRVNHVKKKKHGWSWLRGCTVQPGGLSVPWFFVDFDITGRGCGCVCFWGFFSLRLFFPLLAVNVVVCPIIYLFVGVVCVLANSFTNIFNLWFYICE